MSEVATLTASASGIINQPDTPEFVLIGTTDTDPDLSSLSVTIRGENTIRLTAKTRIVAFAKYLMKGLLGADVKVANLLKIASGAIPKSAIRLGYTNAGATTPKVYFYSDSKETVETVSPVYASEEEIQASSKLRYENFTALMFDPTNLGSISIDFIGEDGEIWTEGEWTAVEADSYNALHSVCDADGRINGLTVIDNKRGNIAGVTLYTASGGSMVVMQINI